MNVMFSDLTNNVIKELNNLWDKKIEGVELTRLENERFRELNKRWENEQAKIEHNNWKSSQCI